MKTINPKPIVDSVTIQNFKSIKLLEAFKLRSINVLIGPNGAGKSNLISFFKMINIIAASPQGFQHDYVAKNGKANGILYNGIKSSDFMFGSLRIETKSGSNFYRFKLGKVGADNLIFTSEEIKYNNKNLSNGSSPDHDENYWRQLIELGSPMSKLDEYKEDATLKVIKSLLKFIKVYQFHDTGKNSLMRASCDYRKGSYLMDNGENLAAYLYNFKEHNNQNYNLIIEGIRTIVPNFIDFHFQLEGSHVTLGWREKGSDYVSEAYQASDGMLRFWCLVSLLYQPAELLPNIVIIDEPELGLHPAAIKYVAELIKRASNFCQIFVSTQSTTLLDEFELDDIIVVEKGDEGSTFNRLSNSDFRAWRDQYTKPSELWDFELIGGRP